MAEWTAALEWAQFARSDMDTAIHLFNTMRPMPLEIICYHCQQAVEKMLDHRASVLEAELERLSGDRPIPWTRREPC